MKNDRCPCCGGELAEVSRTAKSVSLKCTRCGLSDRKLVDAEEVRN